MYGGMMSLSLNIYFLKTFSILFVINSMYMYMYNGMYLFAGGQFFLHNLTSF